MSTPAALYEHAAELLALAEDCLAGSLGGVPDRSYVAVSLPALDCCPQLTVHPAGLAIDAALPTAPATIGAANLRLCTVYLATLVITIVRCTPQPDGITGQPPSPAELDAVAEVIAQDGWLLWNCVANAIANGGLFGAGCLGIYLDSAIPLVESGGCAGWTLQIRARIQAVAETAS